MTLTALQVSDDDSRQVLVEPACHSLFIVDDPVTNRGDRGFSGCERARAERFVTGDFKMFARVSGKQVFHPVILGEGR